MNQNNLSTSLEISSLDTKYQETYKELITNNSFEYVTVVNKSDFCDTYNYYLGLRKIFPTQKILLHFSCEYNSLATLQNYVEKIASDPYAEILIVSGDQKKRDFTTLEALEYTKKIPTWVVYNPNMPTNEYEHLIKKLSHAHVCGVILQIHLDRDTLIQAVVDIESIREDVSIHASTVLLTETTKALLRKKQWKWVSIDYSLLEPGESFEYLHELTNIGIPPIFTGIDINTYHLSIAHEILKK